MNRIEGRLKAEGTVDRTPKRTAKTLDEIAAATAAIEREAGLFGNETLDYEIKVMKERLDYLKTRLPAGETLPSQ